MRRVNPLPCAVKIEAADGLAPKHPSSLPDAESVHILKPLIEAFTQPGQLVPDPFAGSGSTCGAAKRTGRGYLGIELDPEHHLTAINRLAREATKAA